MALETAAFSDSSSESGSDGVVVVSEGEGQVTEESSDEGLDTGLLALICILVVLFVIPMLVWLSINCIAKCCPKSSIGRRFEAWKRKRALDAEQRQLLKLQELRK